MASLISISFSYFFFSSSTFSNSIWYYLKWLETSLYFFYSSTTYNSRSLLVLPRCFIVILSYSIWTSRCDIFFLALLILIAWLLTYFSSYSLCYLTLLTLLFLRLFFRSLTLVLLYVFYWWSCWILLSMSSSYLVKSRLLILKDILISLFLILSFLFCFPYNYFCLFLNSFIAFW